jgi:D-serine dehydratase
MLLDLSETDAAIRKDVRDACPTLWTNTARFRAGLKLHDASLLVGIDDARTRLARFAPLLARVFPELEVTQGKIGSPLLATPRMERALGLPPESGHLFVKCDHQLAVAGSIKARGGLHAVLQITEEIADRHGLLDKVGHDGLNSAEAREVFCRYTISVGSTGNLGLSVGMFASILGFSATVHMSAAAKTWKKVRLREVGAVVVEHDGDYEKAVAAGRSAAERDPAAYFVNDENSLPLLFGYATAIGELQQQLAAESVKVDEDHPLFVYVPCGVGGAPAGIALGLAATFGTAAHCFFVEPVQAPCVLLQMMAGASSHPSIYDVGLSGETEADGMAVPRASLVAVETSRPLIGGILTVNDEDLFRLLALASDVEGLVLEPSATAGFAVPNVVCGTLAGRAYLNAAGLNDRLSRATHLVWTTGGSLLPSEEHAHFVSRGRAFSQGRAFPTAIDH